MFFKIIIIVVDVDLIGISNVLRVSQKWSLIQGRKEGNILIKRRTQHILFYGYLASDIW